MYTSSTVVENYTKTFLETILADDNLIEYHFSKLPNITATDIRYILKKIDSNLLLDKLNRAMANLVFDGGTLPSTILANLILGIVIGYSIGAAETADNYYPPSNEDEH